MNTHLMIFILVFMKLVFPSCSLRITSQGSVAGGEEAPELFIIRSYNPQEGMMNRMNAIAADIKQHLPHMRMAISLDTTSFDARWKHGKFFRELEKKGVLIHQYSTMLLYQSYPALPDKDWLHKAYGNKVEEGVAWGYHAEPLALAVKAAEQHFRQQFRYIWNWEDDIVLCGKISTLLKLHRDRQSQPDLLMIGHVHPVYGAQPHSRSQVYYFEKQVSEDFARRYGEEQRVWGQEQVQRVSGRFFSHLNALITSKVTAWSEMFVATVAQNDGFTIEPFDESLIGEFSWNKTITRKHASKLCEQVGAGEVKIHHSGKFARLETE
eukprot:gnl/MRDRNA2_/MRDRNA2_78692_c0_seq1.p1 gnl/MRDRNA2_/MRDRNA2_78692_c0~~gnl/MRDRNA2_/MRDRNA2_78692_c0_seq1.p1  ORF type:complete len:323 (+),score=36.13 gnl/MRDRNA2_/MRDRNA2_78692_c0_seq1:64-1032(+)